MKRILVYFFVFCFLLGGVVGCNPASSPNGNNGLSAPGSKTRIVCTIFPQYDWVLNILGDNADSFEVTLLLSSRVDLHNFQPSFDDIVKISECDLFIYVGGESDVWVENALKQAVNKDMIVINLLEALGEAAKYEEIIVGMQHDDDHDEFDDNHDEFGDDHDGSLPGQLHYNETGDLDEHIWLSLRNAHALCALITEKIISLDPDNASFYEANLSDYQAKIALLDDEYTLAVNSGNTRTLLFGDRFPFRYLLDDYDIDYFAAFPGCSAETEASFETIVFLSDKLGELSLYTVMVTESSDQAIAKTIINNSGISNCRILVLDSLQAVSQNDVGAGATYLSIMESNLQTIIEALN